MIRIFPPHDQWDQTLIVDLLKQVDHRDITVSVVPGRYYADKPDEINKTICKDKAALIVVTGDEEGLFPTDQLDHPNMKVWLQSPQSGESRRADRYFPIGYTPKTRDDLSTPLKGLKWFFAGQITHARRKHCVKQLREMDGGTLVETKGFNQGIEPEKYAQTMRSAKVVPCPSGAVIPDTFRMYEALESGAIPIGDALDPQNGSRNYFNFLFDDPDLPFPTLESWDDLPGTTNYFFDTYPRYQNRAFAWWQHYKHKLKTYLEQDIRELTGLHRMGIKTDTPTVLIVTSPVASHPDTSMIRETIASVRYHLPQAPIMVLIDGVREEQEEYRPRYEQYINDLLWFINSQENIVPLLFNEHQHQAKMTREALKEVTTATILFVEHDTPLVTDYDIPFRELNQTIVDGGLDMIRFHHEASILADHQHLMVDTEPQNPKLPLLRTAQWSQRPHLASTEYYRRLLADNIHQDSKTMIEDAVHGITQEKWLRLGFPGWNQHRLAIYAPQDGNMKRSYHLDGRGADPKYEMS
jgi:hypothetical protein